MRRAALIGIAGALVAVLTGCGGTEDSAAPQSTPSRSIVTDSPSPPAGTVSSSASPTSTPTKTGPRVEVRIDGDKVTPRAARVDAKVGKPVTFVITSDRPGGLHVHSTPSQTPKFGKGTTTIEVTIDRPGVVEVEEHESNAVIVQLEVR